MLNGITKNEKWRNIMVIWCNGYKLTVHQTTWNFVVLNELNMKGRQYYRYILVFFVVSLPIKEPKTINIKFVTCGKLLFFAVLLSEIICLHGITVGIDNWDLDCNEVSGLGQTNGYCLAFILNGSLYS